jgi:SnoaL-like domain
MITTNSKSRRAFFLNGGAVLGAGVATTAGATALISDDATDNAPVHDQLKQLQQQLALAEDREAIRQLHLVFARSIENQTYESAVALFDERAYLHLSGANATGKSAIEKLFSDQYRQQKASAIHSAYRQSASQRSDVVTISDDHQQATATFHVEVELCSPLPVDSTIAKMARLQGHMVNRHWEVGRFEAKYVKTQGQWKMASLNYLSS